MGYVIKCPYYNGDKRRTISCEGCIKFFNDLDKKKTHLLNVCQDNYKSCNYYMQLQAVYDESSKLEDKEAISNMRLRFYNDSKERRIKRLIQYIGIVERNVASNIEIKQREIKKLQGMVKIAVSRESIALMELAAVMYQNGITEIDTGELESFRQNYIFKFEVSPENDRILILKTAERIAENDDRGIAEEISDAGEKETGDSESEKQPI